MVDNNDPTGTPSIEDAIHRIERAEQDLAEAEREERLAEEREHRAEHEFKEAVDELKELEHHHHGFQLIVNRVQHRWPREEITGAEIKQLAGSPSDWVVNIIVDGPGDDPEIADGEEVNLAFEAPPKGEKRFMTRKPKTAPGS